MKPHYFEQSEADTNDFWLTAAKLQGCVPKTCLQGGWSVLQQICAGKHPCAGCNGPREKCGGPVSAVAQ